MQANFKYCWLEYMPENYKCVWDLESAILRKFCIGCHQSISWWHGCCGIMESLSTKREVNYGQMMFVDNSTMHYLMEKSSKVAHFKFWSSALDSIMHLWLSWVRSFLNQLKESFYLARITSLTDCWLRYLAIGVNPHQCLQVLVECLYTTLNHTFG